jgi:hypothetical protein
MLSVRAVQILSRSSRLNVKRECEVRLESGK